MYVEWAKLNFNIYEKKYDFAVRENAFGVVAPGMGLY